MGSGYEVYRDIPPYVNPKPLDCGKGCLCLEVTSFGVGRTTLSNKPQVQEVSGFAVGTLDLGGGEGDPHIVPQIVGSLYKDQK